jgi:hypothetical protein
LARKSSPLTFVKELIFFICPVGILKDYNEYLELLKILVAVFICWFVCVLCGVLGTENRASSMRSTHFTTEQHPIPSVTLMLPGLCYKKENLT